MKKTFILSLVIFLLAIIFAGCASNKNEDNPQTSSDPVASTETPAPEVTPAEPVELTVVAQAGKDGTETREEIWDRVESQVPGVKIKVVWATDSTANKQNQLLAAGTPPDLIRGGDVYTSVYSGFLEPLDAYLDKDADLKNGLSPEIMKNLRDNNETVWLPLNYNIGLLYYNKKLFDADKMDYPTNDWTWDDFNAAAKKLTKLDADGKPLQWGAETTFGWWGEWLVWVRAAGGEFMTKGKVTMDTPEAVKGLDAFTRKTRGDVKSGPQPGESDLGNFAGGKVAMVYSGHTGNFGTYNKVEGLEWDVVALPKGPSGARGAELAVDAFGITKASAHKEKAWEVIKFLTSEKGIVGDLAKSGAPVALFSAAKAAMDVPKADRTSPANLENIGLASEEGIVLPNDKDFVHMAINIAQPEIDKMLEGKQTSEETGKKITEQCNNYIASR